MRRACKPRSVTSRACMRFRRFIVPGCIVVAAVALLALLTYGVSNHTDTSSIDAKVAAKHYPLAPDYTTKLPLLGTSTSRSLASFKGKVVVMNIWASWCAPCQAEAPMLARYEKTLKREGATFVGIAYETSAAQAESFDHRYGVGYPILRDVNGDLVRDLGTYLVPETFILNRRGRIVALERSEITTHWAEPASGAGPQIAGVIERPREAVRPRPRQRRSASVSALSELKRAYIFPAGDVGLRVAIGWLDGFREPPFAGFASSDAVHHVQR